MLENYLNKRVIVEEKLFHGPSSLYSRGIGSRLSAGASNTEEGVLTSISNEYIELDHKQLIAKQFIYRIILK